VIIIEYLIVSVLLGSGCIAGGTIYAHTSGVYEHWSFGSPHAWNWFMWFRMSLRWVKDRMNTHTHTHTHTPSLFNTCSYAVKSVVSLKGGGSECTINWQSDW